MGNTYNYNKYIYIFLFLLLITGILFYVNSKIAFEKIETIKNEKYAIKAQSIKERVKALIKDKQNSTLSIALVLAQDKSIHEKLLGINKQELTKLGQNSLQLRQYSHFKNVWFHIINAKGVSQYRSWAKKRGDSILKVRLDVVEMIKNPRIMTTISTGIFDMTFKAMVPIFKDNEFIGIAEVITHFNSIAKRMMEAGVNPVILVDKRYKKQIRKPFTKLFVDDYYVANYNAKPQLMQYIKNNGVENFINKTNYLLKDNYFISFYHLPDIKNKPMGYFVFFQNLDSIDVTEIESFKFVSKIIILTLSGFFILGIFLILFLARKNKMDAINKTLYENNQLLQETVQAEVEKNKKKNLLLQKQNRLVALGEMMENIAHQWRQPLSAISTSASGLKLKFEYDEKMEKEERDEYLNAIINNTQHLSMTIDDFRNFFKQENIKEPFNIAQTITQSYDIVKALYQAKYIDIHFDMDESLEYDGYKREFTQVILNLLNNSKDALIANETLDKKLVFIGVKQDNSDIIITIKDNAGGVPEDISERIFDPYFTTKHKSQGTGIGLYMCQEIINDHFKGSIYQQNETVEFENQTYTCANFIIKLSV